MLDWWIYIIVAGILFCGYKFLEEIIYENRVVHEEIEKEGKPFMDRLHGEKERKRLKQTS